MAGIRVYADRGDSVSFGGGLICWPTARFSEGWADDDAARDAERDELGGVQRPRSAGED
jgi:hypothetical protein